VNLLWQERGYTPIVLLTGDRELWNSSKRSKCVLEYSEKSGTKTIFVKQVLNYRNSTIAQISRLFACADPSLNPTDYFLTSDADMLPLSRTWFNEYDASKSFNFFGGNACMERPGDASPTNLPTLMPMCYLGATIANWRQVMNVKELSLQASMEQTLKEQAAVGIGDGWTYDETTFARKMFQSPLLVQSQFINRGWIQSRATHRLDRLNWNFRGETDLIDCHFLRPGYTNLSEIYRVLIPYIYCYPNNIRFINEYVEAFVV
jgi:hypothetical protein